MSQPDTPTTSTADAGRAEPSAVEDAIQRFLDTRSPNRDGDA